MGTISNTITHGITLGTSGTYASPLTITATGAVTAGTTIAVIGTYPSAAPWTVANYGAVQGYGGIDIGKGTVTNAGTIVGAGGNAFGIDADPLGTVFNTGSLSLITGSGYGILGGRQITNAGTISGSQYVGVSAGSGTVNNTGRRP